jgi:hydrophobic/amphiphilic exporter-1 (mainly G- bacteria), HAE1 family
MQKLAEICIRRPVFATMLIMALVVMGLASYRKLGVDYFPKVEFPIVTISTTLRGAAPEEVETQVTKRIEEAVNTISGIDDLTSVSSEGVSLVSIQFVLDKDPDAGAQEVRDKIASIASQLPKDADPSIVDKLATDASPVLNVVFASNRDLRETTKLVEDRVKKNLESLSGVGQVRFVGDRRRQVQVWLDGEKLYSYNLNIDQVRTALIAQNVEVPGGRVDQGSRELSLRTLGRIEQPRDFERIIIGNVNGTPVRIQDIGHVVDGVEEPRSLARLDGTPAVVLEIRKQAGTNTLDVIHDVKERVSSVMKSMPHDFKVSYTRDQSEFISDAFHAVQEHLMLGGVFAAIVVLLFIRSWRSTLIAAVAIPASIISTYTLMNLMGFTLNQITMLGLVLTVGIVIDDAIVVLENIFKFAEEKGMSPVEAAIHGTRDIGLAVLATTLSLAIIFIPVALMGGIVGKFMSSFGYTAAFAIMVSLLVSFTLTPMLCSRYLKPSKGGGTKDTAVYRAFAAPYRTMLEWSMNHRWVIVTISVLVMLSTVPLFMIIGKDFLTTDDQSEFEVTVRTPPGSSLDGTDQIMKQLEAEVKHLPGIRNLLTTVGADVRKQVDHASIIVELVPFQNRKESQQQLMDMARDRFKKYRDLTIGVQLPSLIQGSASDREFMFFVQGPDLNRLNEYATSIKAKLQEIPGMVDLDSSYEPGKPELRVRINRDKASDLNVNVASVATALRTLVGGDQQATSYREGDDRYDVQLRVDQEFRNSPAALDRLFVPSATLGNVPISSVARLEHADGPVQIQRYNRQRQIMLSANLAGGQSLSNVLQMLDGVVKGLNMPPEYRTGLVGRSKEFGRAASNYLIALVLSLAFMYMILAAQFESFIDPVTILISLPLSVPFALLSLLLTHENYSIIYTSLGILVLFGIVKKNSILQVDHVKNLRRAGMPRREAILKGCEDRLRPILMTTAALVAGMIPMALGGGAGSGSRRTVAIVVIGGQTLCLLLTLLITPVAYSIFDDLSDRLRGLARFRFPLNRAARSATTLILVFALLGATVRAETLAQRAAPAILDAPARVGVSITERKLSLGDAIQMALASNLDLEIERTNVANAEQAIRAATGAFDPTFRYAPGLTSNNTPTSSILQGAGGVLTERGLTQNFYFKQRLPWQGAQVNVDFENGRQASTNAFASLNPFFTSRLVIGYSQPLLRNRTIDRERSEIILRRKQAEVAGADFEVRAADIVTRVEQAYWDLVAARQDVQVTSDAVELAKQQHSHNRRMIDSGTLAPVELSASRAELERRLDIYYASVGTLTEIENNLKMLLAPDRHDSIWGDQIAPTDLNMQHDSVEDVQEAVTEALKHRPELKQVALRRESNKIDRQYASEQVKPQINAVANYSNAGLGGLLRPGDNPISASQTLLYDRLNTLSTLAGLQPLNGASFGSLPPIIVGGYGTALSSLFGGNYQSVQVGLSVDFTLHNRTAEAQLAQTAINEKRLKLEQARAEQTIEAQVRNALQAMQTARQRISAAEASVAAAKEKLESETRLYDTGESTNFFVLTRQNEYLDARRRAVVAQLDFNKAVARLEQSLGNTLGAHHLSLK